MFCSIWQSKSDRLIYPYIKTWKPIIWMPMKLCKPESIHWNLYLINFIWSQWTVLSCLKIACEPYFIAVGTSKNVRCLFERVFARICFIWLQWTKHQFSVLSKNPLFQISWMHKMVWNNLQYGGWVGRGWIRVINKACASIWFS